MEAIKKVLVCLSIIIVSVLINTELYAQDQERTVIYLKDGSIIRGNLVDSIPSSEVRIQTEDGKISVYKLDQIEKIEEEVRIDWTCNLNVFLGNKYLFGGDWEPVDQQTQWGVLLDFKRNNWPVSVAIDYLHSLSDASGFLYTRDDRIFAERTLKISELNLGVQKIWDKYRPMHLFIGGGIALIEAKETITARGTCPLPSDAPTPCAGAIWLGRKLFGETYEGASSSDDDIGTGIWIKGGAYWLVSERVNMGFNVRWSKADVSLYDVDADAGGGHAGVILGYHW